MNHPMNCFFLWNGISDEVFRLLSIIKINESTVALLLQNLMYWYIDNHLWFLVGLGFLVCFCLFWFGFYNSCGEGEVRIRLE